MIATIRLAVCTMAHVCPSLRRAERGTNRYPALPCVTDDANAGGHAILKQFSKRKKFPSQCGRYVCFRTERQRHHRQNCALSRIAETQAVGRFQVERPSICRPPGNDFAPRALKQPLASVNSAELIRMDRHHLHEEPEMTYDARPTPGIAKDKGFDKSPGYLAKRETRPTHTTTVRSMTTRLSLFERVKKRLIAGFGRNGDALYRPRDYEIEILPSGASKPSRSIRREREFMAAAVAAHGIFGVAQHYWTNRKTAEEKRAQTSSNLG
jgi:hypothetical protein